LLRDCEGAEAPLVVLDPLVPVVEAGAGAGAGAGVGAATDSVGVVGAGVDAPAAGGGAGVAGVPNVPPVQAHDRLAPTTVTNPAKIAIGRNRPRLRTSTT